MTPADFASERSGRASGFIRLPGLWKGTDSSGTPLRAQGHATYRLRVKTGSDSGRRTLLINTPLSACRVWVNGRLAGASGEVGTNRGEETPRAHVVKSSFMTRGETQDILVQVSNYHNVQGGLNAPIWLGSESQMGLLVRRKESFAAAFGGFFALMGFFHLAFYLRHRSEPANLYFGLYAMMWAVITAFSNQGGCLVSELYPALPWRMTIDLTLIPYSLSVPLLVMFYHALFPYKGGVWVERVYQALSGFFIVYLVFSPPNAYGLVPMLYRLVVLSMVPYLLWRFVVDLVRKMEGARILIPGYLILGISGLSDLFFDFGLSHTLSMVPYGAFAFVLSYSLLIAIRFFNAFSAVERLNHELKENNRTLKENLTLRKELAERKQTEQNLRVTQRRLTGMLNTLDDAMVAINENGEVSFCNRAFETFCGSTAQEILGISWLRLVAAEAEEKASELEARWLNTGAMPQPERVQGIVFQRGACRAVRTEVTAVRLDLEEEPMMLLILDDKIGEALDQATDRVYALNLNRRRIEELKDSLERIASSDLTTRFDLTEDLDSIDRVLGHIRGNLSMGETGSGHRHQAVAVMQLALELWKEAAGRGKVALARQSGLWKVYTDKDGWDRTQTLDKYLNEESIPQKPRVAQVIRTAEFVLAACDGVTELRSSLERHLEIFRRDRA
ncbi:7TM diverse intracellular signaling domain-containing protein [Desulfoluna sp.]|uniref:7TM diverse intracellular signaling domain-containing protein n=1 Tax=Desulfoluna sp. TaxID=2045199 RepID=UPI00260DF4BD|nr:7TM diverse intracellular signaling domain-containing protein [Desulfoluna sp.]